MGPDSCQLGELHELGRQNTCVLGGFNHIHRAVKADTRLMYDSLRSWQRVLSAYIRAYTARIQEENMAARINTTLLLKPPPAAGATPKLPLHGNDDQAKSFARQGLREGKSHGLRITNEIACRMTPILNTESPSKSFLCTLYVAQYEMVI